MSCLSDLLDLSDDERLALCNELGRMTRIAPLYPLTATANPSLSPDAGAAVAVGGSLSQQQGVQ